MEVGDCLEDLFHDATRVALGVDRFLHDAVQQLSSKSTTNESCGAISPLNNHDNLLVALKDVTILDDVFVTDRSEEIRVKEEDSRWVAKLFRNDLGTKILSSVAIHKHGKGFEFGFGPIFQTFAQRDGIINICFHYISLATMDKTHQKEHKYLT